MVEGFYSFFLVVSSIILFHSYKYPYIAPFLSKLKIFKNRDLKSQPIIIAQNEENQQNDERVGKEKDIQGKKL